MYQALPFGDIPVASMFRKNPADFPSRSSFTEKTWTDANLRMATAEIVEIADGGRRAAEVLTGPIDKRAWPHDQLAKGWAQVVTQTKAAGQSLYTAQERWLQLYWAWWLNKATATAGGINVEKDDQVRSHFGDDAPLTHWRSDLVQRTIQWVKADQAIRRGFPAPGPAMLASQMEKSLTDFYQRPE